MNRQGEEAGYRGGGGFGARESEIEPFQPREGRGELYHVSVRQEKGTFRQCPAARWYFQMNEVWEVGKRRDECRVNIADKFLEAQVRVACNPV